MFWWFVESLAVLSYESLMRFFGEMTRIESDSNFNARDQRRKDGCLVEFDLSQDMTYGKRLDDEIG